MAAAGTLGTSQDTAARSLRVRASSMLLINRSLVSFMMIQAKSAGIVHRLVMTSCLEPMMTSSRATVAGRWAPFELKLLIMIAYAGVRPNFLDTGVNDSKIQRGTLTSISSTNSKQAARFCEWRRRCWLTERILNGDDVCQPTPRPVGSVAAGLIDGRFACRRRSRSSCTY